MLHTGTPDYTVCPGSFILEAMDGAGIQEFAKRLDMPLQRFLELLGGDTPLTSDIADRLEKATSTPARIWLALERTYREATEREMLMARISQTKKALETVPAFMALNRESLENEIQRLTERLDALEDTPLYPVCSLRVTVI